MIPRGVLLLVRLVRRNLTAPLTNIREADYAFCE
jgi:hypothetical protein